MKHTIKKSLFLFTLIFCQFIYLKPVFAKNVNLNLNDSLLMASTNAHNHENVPVSKISLPDRNMIKKADNEMHRNMKADLAEAKAMMKVLRELTPSDVSIHVDFFSNFLVALPQNLGQGDETISANFAAENIAMSNIKILQIADFQINKSFYLSN